MKRSVAVVGPTPAFLRWAIWHPCSLRPLHSDRFADKTFRQLRAIREFSVARSEGRCHDGFCVHPTADPADPKTLLGFTIDEVTDAFGGLEVIQNACDACPANVNRGPEHNPPLDANQSIHASPESKPLLAGCYGFLPTRPFSFDRLLSGYEQRPTPDFDLVDAIDQIVVRNNLVADLNDAFPQMRNAEPLAVKPASTDRPLVWFLLWKETREGSLNETKLEQPQLRVLLRIFQRLVEQWEDVVPSSENKTAVPSDAIIQFRDAVEGCVEKKLPLIAELIPSGNSDGSRWSLSPSCPECRFEPANLPDVTAPTRCSSCGWFGPFQPGPKFKVLGLRPYVHLAGIIGAESFKTPKSSKTPIGEKKAT